MTRGWMAGFVLAARRAGGGGQSSVRRGDEVVVDVGDVDVFVGGELRVDVTGVAAEPSRPTAVHVATRAGASLSDVTERGFYRRAISTEAGSPSADAKRTFGPLAHDNAHICVSRCELLQRSRA